LRVVAAATIRALKAEIAGKGVSFMDEKKDLCCKCGQWVDPPNILTWCDRVYGYCPIIRQVRNQDDCCQFAIGFFPADEDAA